MKPNPTVSLKQKIQMLHFPGVIKSDALETKSKDDKSINAVISQKDPPKAPDIPKQIKRDLGAINKSPKAVSGMSLKFIKPSINTSSERSDSDMSIKPWSKLKLATLISTSSNNLAKFSPGDSDIDVKTFSTNETPQAQTQTSTVLTSATTSTQSIQSIAAAAALPPKCLQPTIILENFRKHTNSSSANNTSESRKYYHSVFDLSPEYSGLPFVKRLKILNERQKLAELEQALQTRSFSLDSSKTGNQLAVSEPLYRCFSDVSEMYSKFFTAYESSSSTSTNTSISNNNNQRRDKYIPPAYLPLSPELNETAERRKLKYVLQELHRSSEECKRQNEDTAVLERPSKRLLREPTIEGYVARHSMLMKSITFKSTLSSPPHSALKSVTDEHYDGLSTVGEDQDHAVKLSCMPAISASGIHKYTENRVLIDTRFKSESKRRNTIQYTPSPSYTNQRTTKRLKTTGAESIKTEGNLLFTLIKIT